MECMKPAYFFASCWRRPEGNRHEEGGSQKRFTFTLSFCFGYSPKFIKQEVLGLILLVPLGKKIVGIFHVIFPGTDRTH